jgi:hypothetical protein
MHANKHQFGSAITPVITERLARRRTRALANRTAISVTLTPLLHNGADAGRILRLRRLDPAF